MTDDKKEKYDGSANLSPFKKKEDCTPEEWAKQEEYRAKARATKEKNKAEREALDALKKEIETSGMDGFLRDRYLAYLSKNPALMDDMVERQVDISINGDDKAATAAFNSITTQTGMKAPTKQEVKVEEKMTKQEAEEILKKKGITLKVVGGKDIDETDDD